MNNKNGKNGKNNILYNLLIFIGIIIIIIIIVQIYFKFTTPSDLESKMKEYDVQLPIEGDAKNMNICPKGCIRGACNKKIGGCSYDFQCQYCRDNKTNMFFVDMNDESRIQALLEEEEKLNSTQKNMLNEDIEKNNKYIDLLNKKIVMMNS